MSEVRLAVLGAGRIGRVHAQAIGQVPGAVLQAIADPVAAAADEVAAAHGGRVDDIDAIAAADDVDAVVICTPTDTHAALIERFAHAGKAIFCEKPIDLDVARVQRCLAVVDATRTTLMVGFQRRFDPDFAALKAAIDAGRIGEVESVTLTSRDPAPPPLAYLAHSGGLFRDMMIHDFDVARWLLDDTVVSVQAIGSVLVDASIGAAGDIDTATVLMRTARGRHCTISCSRRASYGYDQRIEVHGSQGSVSATNHHLACIEVATADGFARPPLLDFFMSRYARAYAAEMAAFVAAVRGDAPVTTGGADGLAALVLADAAVRSMASGRAVDPAGSIEPVGPS